MSYQVIARKWRPKTFEEVTGQEAITRTLRNAIANRRLHHAYLFAGPRGVGKTTTARLFAKALNCAQGPTPSPCGSCPSCQEISDDKLTSIDVLEIDAASHTGVDNIREIIVSTVANRPARDRYKIFIIDEVHMLSISAFNALLKTLEEPPSHVMFILATTELHKLPETILSRCQQFEFRSIGVDLIEQRLRLIAEAEGVTIARDALRQVAAAGRGSMRDAQSAFDQVIAFSGMEIEEHHVQEALGLIGVKFLSRVVDALAAQDAPGMLALVDELTRTGYDLRQFIHEIMTYIRHLLVVRTAGMDSELLPVGEEERVTLDRQARHFSGEDLVRFFTILTEVEQNLRFANEPRFQVEFGLVKLTQLARLKSLETILEALQGGTPSAAPPTGTPPPGRTPPAPSRPAPPRATAPPPSRPTGALPPAAADRLPAVQTNATAAHPARESARVEEDIPEPPPWMDDFDPGEPGGPPTRLAPQARPTLVPPPSAPVVHGSLLDRIKADLESHNKMLLVASLERVTDATLDGGELLLTFPADATEYHKQVTDPRNLVILQEAVKRVTGEHAKARARLGTAAATSAAPSETEFKLAQLRKQAESDPAVQAILKTFRGKLVDVRPGE